MGMKCQLIAFIDPRGHKVKIPHQGPILALIMRKEKHPKLGDPVPGKVTVTSRVKLINYPCGYFITENSVYDFGGQS